MSAATDRGVHAAGYAHRNFSETFRLMEEGHHTASPAVPKCARVLPRIQCGCVGTTTTELWWTTPEEAGARGLSFLRAALEQPRTLREALPQVSQRSRYVEMRPQPERMQPLTDTRSAPRATRKEREQARVLLLQLNPRLQWARTGWKHSPQPCRPCGQHFPEARKRTRS